MEKDKKKSEEILKLGLLDQAKRVQKSVRGFYNHIVIYYILALIAIVKKNSLIEIIKLYDERISFYQGVIDDLENVIDEMPRETSWLGRKLSRMRTILQKAREERSQVVEIYEEFI